MSKNSNVSILHQRLNFPFFRYRCLNLLLSLIREREQERGVQTGREREREVGGWKRDREWEEKKIIDKSCVNLLYFHIHRDMTYLVRIQHVNFESKIIIKSEELYI